MPVSTPFRTRLLVAAVLLCPLSALAGNVVFSNGLEGSSRSGSGKLIAAFPDVCFTPPESPSTPPGVPIPYPNISMASDTAKGAKKIKVADKNASVKLKQTVTDIILEGTGVLPVIDLITGEVIEQPTKIKPLQRPIVELANGEILTLCGGKENLAFFDIDVQPATNSGVQLLNPAWGVRQAPLAATACPANCAQSTQDYNAAAKKLAFLQEQKDLVTSWATGAVAGSHFDPFIKQATLELAEQEKVALGCTCNADEDPDDTQGTTGRNAELIRTAAEELYQIRLQAEGALHEALDNRELDESSALNEAIFGWADRMVAVCHTNGLLLNETGQTLVNRAQRLPLGSQVDFVRGGNLFRLVIWEALDDVERQCVLSLASGTDQPDATVNGLPHFLGVGVELVADPLPSDTTLSIQSAQDTIGEALHSAINTLDDNLNNDAYAGNLGGLDEDIYTAADKLLDVCHQAGVLRGTTGEDMLNQLQNKPRGNRRINFSSGGMLFRYVYKDLLKMVATRCVFALGNAAEHQFQANPQPAPTLAEPAGPGFPTDAKDCVVDAAAMSEQLSGLAENFLEAQSEYLDQAQSGYGDAFAAMSLENAWHAMTDAQVALHSAAQRYNQHLKPQCPSPGDGELAVGSATPVQFEWKPYKIELFNLYISLADETLEVCTPCQAKADAVSKTSRAESEAKTEYSKLQNSERGANQKLSNLREKGSLSAAEYEEYAQLKQALRSTTERKQKLSVELRALRSQLEAEKLELMECLFFCDIKPVPLAALTDSAPSSGQFTFHMPFFYFVGTRCDNPRCIDIAHATNRWVQDQLNRIEAAIESAMEDAASASDGELDDDSDKVKALGRELQNKYFQVFFAELAIKRAELEACEAKYCADKDKEVSDTGFLPGDPYQAQNIASEACLDATAGFNLLPWDCAEFTASGGDCSDLTPQFTLPPACAGGSPDDWIDTGCAEDSCADVAFELPPTDLPDCLGTSNPAPSGWTVYSAGSCSTAILDSLDGELGAVRALQDPDDPYTNSVGTLRKGLHDQWALLRAMGVTSPDELPQDNARATTLVAVIDSGLDVKHPDLLGRTWINTAEIPRNGVDDDANGLVDDTHGWNFVGNNNNPRDNNGHGTLVAGIIAAVPGNGLGIAGVNAKARILPLKVTDYRGVGNAADISAAIHYAMEAGAKIINMSLGGRTFSRVEQAAIAAASDNDILVVVAAGNLSIDTAAFWPAGLENVLTVTATDSENARAEYANWGNAVDIAAPGNDVLSLRGRYTDPMYFASRDYERGSHIVGPQKYLYKVRGTSFATPFVSGVASLLWSANPDLTAAQVKRMLLQSARDIESPGRDTLSGFGLLDGSAALAADPDYFIEALITTIAPQQTSQGLQIQVKGTASADEFASAQVQLGRGETPESWSTVSDTLTDAVLDGVLAQFDSQALQGAARWTLRLRVTHKNGSERVFEFPLSLQ